MRSTAFKTALVAGVALLGLSACAGNSRQKDLAYVERPVETIYNEATHSLDRRNWDLAAAQFDEVQRQHPYSPWAQRAMLMSAYARYRSRDYDKAMSSAQDYISLHPAVMARLMPTISSPSASSTRSSMSAAIRPARTSLFGR